MTTAGRTALLALVALGSAPAAWAQPLRAPATVDAALLDLVRGPSAAFQGRQRATVYLDDGSKAVAEVLVFGDGRGAVRREYRSGLAEGLVVLQRDGRAWERDAGGAWTSTPQAPVADPSAVARQLAANYHVAVGPPTRIAGRPATPITLRPRQAFCPSRAVWIDRALRLVLRDELRAPGGELRSASDFITVSPGRQHPSQFEAPASASPAGRFGPASFAPQATAAAVERATGRRPPSPAHVPAGFRVASYGVMTTGSGRLMPAVRYSDGLAAFTVFERGGGRGPGGGPGGRGPGFGRRAGMGMGGPGRGRRGAGPPAMAGQTPAVADGRQQAIVACRGALCDYLLVGDISAAELQRVARSLP